jgi:starch phosphorylase
LVDKSTKIFIKILKGFFVDMETLIEKMPAKIKRLPELAYNLWWSWTPEARTLFRKLDIVLWRETQHNPVKMLNLLTDEQLHSVANDPDFMRWYTKVMMQFDKAMDFDGSWFNQRYDDLTNEKIAYFSFEFGMHNSLPIYSGGLGILSGDHAKETSDMGLPFVGIGFMYPQGYFRQRIPSHGWQESVYEQLDMHLAPIQLVKGDDGHNLKIAVPLGDHEVFAQVWHVQVGRTPLYLLDTDVDENNPWDRELSARLYAGDSEMRIRQEIMLGLGGVRLLRKLNINPSVWHMNEGHSAFLLLECLREKMHQGMTYEQAKAEVNAQSVFTTHTPVPAGHDAFSFHMLDKYLGSYWADMGLAREELLSLGEHEESWGTAFNMTVLALKLSGRANGVSKLHGEVSREMWQEVWPDHPLQHVPITHVTNGVHVPTWISSEMSDLYGKYIGKDWRDRQDDPDMWEKLNDLPGKKLWRMHEDLKHKLIHYLRERTREKWINGINDSLQVLAGGRLLDPNALTIGFARRFATYKRATLIFKDMERLRRLLLDSRRPVQIVFAGKSHPADDGGKHLIQEIFNLAKSNHMGGRIAFIEDYDMHVARYLTQGVDVWLNTPRRPREASGTSGMKASLNGVPNLSILDGWWVEAYNGANGWAIGTTKEYDSAEEQDWADAMSLYELLEQEVVPLFYNRDQDGVPRGWVELMREAIKSNAPQFSMRRMLADYTQDLYVPAMRREPLPDFSEEKMPA